VRRYALSLRRLDPENDRNDGQRQDTDDDERDLIIRKAAAILRFGAWGGVRLGGQYLGSGQERYRENEPEKHDPSEDRDFPRSS
jgi:hypothetical protein